MDIDGLAAEIDAQNLSRAADLARGPRPSNDFVEHRRRVGRGDEKRDFAQQVLSAPQRA